MSDGNSDGVDNSDSGPDSGPNQETLLLYFRETEVFGIRKQGQPQQWLEHVELYMAIGDTIPASHITGLQRIRGLWRIHVQEFEDKVTLMTHGVPIRGKRANVLKTAPGRLDAEVVTRVIIKNIPLTTDDELIRRTLTEKGVEIRSLFREKLRVNDKLTNCETGDRLLTVKSSTLKEPLPQFMNFGIYSARVIHTGQSKQGDKSVRPKKCSKCLSDGHVFSRYPNDWVCRNCSLTGHKMYDCPLSDKPESGEEDESDTTTDSAKSTFRKMHAAATKGHDNQAKSLPTSPIASIGLDRRAAIRTEIQKSMIDFFTPNKDKPKLVNDRSPPTPAEEYRDKIDKTDNKKHHKKK